MNGKQIRFIGFYLSIMLIAAIIIGMAACSSKATSTSTSTNSVLTISSLAISPASPASLAVGSEQQFVAIATYSDGSKRDSTILANWTSSVTTAATISSYGSATGVAPGNTTITATLNGVTSSPVGLTVISATSTIASP